MDLIATTEYKKEIQKFFAEEEKEGATGTKTVESEQTQ